MKLRGPTQRAIVDLAQVRALLRSCRNDPAADFAKTYTVIVALAPARDRELVAILEPLACLTIWQFQWIRTAPGQLQHAAARFFGFAANRSAREQIARLKVASADSVMRELLGNAPIKILEVCARDRVRRFHFRRLQFRLQLNVENEIAFCAQVR